MDDNNDVGFGSSANRLIYGIGAVVALGIIGYLVYSSRPNQGPNQVAAEKRPAASPVATLSPAHSVTSPSSLKSPSSTVTTAASTVPTSSDSSLTAANKVVGQIEVEFLRTIEPRDANATQQLKITLARALENGAKVAVVDGFTDNGGALANNIKWSANRAKWASDIISSSGVIPIVQRSWAHLQPLESGQECWLGSASDNARRVLVRFFSEGEDKFESPDWQVLSASQAARVQFCKDKAKKVFVDSQ